MSTGPSTRPVPQRTLPYPARLTVAQRDPQGHLSTGGPSDVQALKSDLVRRGEAARKADKWADRLMEDTPGLSAFKKALAYLTPRQYVEVLHERHLNGRCSYPACGNACKRPYDPRKKIRISWTSRTISDCEGNPEDGFCSRACTVKSEWVLGQLGGVDVWERVGGKGKAVRLLEEEAEGVQREALTGTRGVALPPGGPTADENGEATPPASKAAPTVPKVTTPQASKATTSTPPVGTPLSTTRLRPAAGQPTQPDKQPETDASTLTTQMMGSLTVHERPTPSVIPPAPSLHPPKPAPSLEAQGSDTPSNTAIKSSRRAGASLVSTPAQLSSKFLQASRQMGPVPQLPPDTEDEDDPYGEEEARMGLGWGQEDDDVRRLFEEAQRAMDMEAEEAEEV